MSDGHPTPPLKHVLTTAREYLTHWFTAGVILTLTGFTPDHWVERLFHALKLDDLRDSLPAVDYRLLAVGVGVAVSTCALIFQNRRARKAPLAAALSPTGAPALATVPVIEDLDDIARKPSIAVLPFVNLSSDPEQEYFADGMTEDIITGLSCDSRCLSSRAIPPLPTRASRRISAPWAKNSASAMCSKAASAPSATVCGSQCS